MISSQFDSNIKYSDFEKDSTLGQGTYGIVKKVKHKITGEIYALKELKDLSETEGLPSTSLREIALLKKLNHPNIIKLYGVLNNSYKKFSLIFEYAETDMKDYLDKKLKTDEFLLERTVKEWVYQILLGTAYCHSEGILHRDIKSNNLLLTKNGTVKIADFGLARPFHLPVRPYTKEVITLWYRCPEILLGAEEYYTAADMWSVGCVMWELSNKRSPFCGDSQIGQIMEIFSMLGTPNEDTWPGVTSMKYFKPTIPDFKGKDLVALCPRIGKEGFDLLFKLLEPCPIYRLEAIEAIQHPWFDDLDKSKYADPDELVSEKFLDL
jgi:serine/threonine protein kinase